MQDNIKRIHSNLYLVHDLQAAADFYTKLGFTVATDDSTARIKLGDVTLAFMDEKSVEIANEAGITPKGVGIYTYVEVRDVDAHYATVVTNGTKPSGEPKTWPWGKREFAVKDPDGYKIVFYSAV